VQRHCLVLNNKQTIAANLKQARGQIEKEVKTISFEGVLESSSSPSESTLHGPAGSEKNTIFMVFDATRKLEKAK
jgi:hypothetical protein